jgi:hypothetical protein
MPSGGACWSRPSADARDRIAIRVVDQGVGMPPEVVERALEPFFTTKGPGRGTGLGLSMAYGVAKAAGGDLRIDSAPGEGTTVTMLPAARHRRDAAATATPARTTRCCAAAVGVLLVDDDPEVRQAVADMLRKAGTA